MKIRATVSRTSTPRTRSAFGWVLVALATIGLGMSSGVDALPSPQEDGEARSGEARGSEDHGSEGRGSGTGSDARQIGAGDTVEVRLVTVPFYAVDEAGRPVHGLTADDLVLEVEGEPVEIASFEHRSLGRSNGAPGAAVRGDDDRPRPLAESRHVVLLFDLAFSTPQGLDAAREATGRWIEGDLTAADRVTLLVHHSEHGFRRELGPAAATPAVRRQLVERIAGLEPDVGKLRPGLAGGMAEMDPSGGRGPVGSQLGWRLDAVAGVGAEEYRAQALDFADGLERLAAELRLVEGPKLLLMASQGIDSTWYHEGLEGLGYGSTASTVVRSHRFWPIRNQFEKPLRALASSGVLPVFLNGAGPGGSAAPGRATLDHMSRETGGIVVAGNDPGFLSERLGRSTSAFYEVGFYAAPGLGEDGRARARVSVRRPGVEVWAAGWLDTRDGLTGLSEAEREALVVELVREGAASLQGRKDVRVVDLNGELKTLTQGDRRYLQFDPQPRPSGKDLEIYSVVLGASEAAGGAAGPVSELRTFESFDPRDPLRAVVTSDAPGGHLWGLVVLDPEAGTVHLRRLTITPERRQGRAAVPAATPAAAPAATPTMELGTAVRSR